MPSILTPFELPEALPLTAAVVDATDATTEAKEKPIYSSRQYLAASTLSEPWQDEELGVFFCVLQVASCKFVFVLFWFFFFSVVWRFPLALMSKRPSFANFWYLVMFGELLFEAFWANFFGSGT